MKYRYIIFDVYEVDLFSGELTKDDIIGKANTKQEIKKIWKNQVEDTDGECDIWIFDKVQRKFVDYNSI